jgi:hypothetical protein
MPGLKIVQKDPGILPLLSLDHPPGSGGLAGCGKSLSARFGNEARNFCYRKKQAKERFLRFEPALRLRSGQAKAAGSPAGMTNVRSFSAAY